LTAPLFSPLRVTFSSKILAKSILVPEHEKISPPREKTKLASRFKRVKKQIKKGEFRPSPFNTRSVSRLKYFSGNFIVPK
jgi:hypothetical protein